MEIIGRNYQNGKKIRVVINSGIIEAVYPYEGTQGTRRSSMTSMASVVQTAQSTLSTDPPDLTENPDLDLPYIAPGLVDLQLNGYQGVDLNGPGLRPEDIRQMVHTLWSQGVTSFFPTVITNTTRMIADSLRVIAAACDQYPEVAAAVLGIHLEGPFISPEEGPRGAHKTEFVKAPDWDLLLSWQQEAGNRIKLITLSPEWPGSNEFIEKCVGIGIKVAIGHTAATRKQIRQAAVAGITLSTHLGNGCHQVLPRFPNYIWNQLATDQLWSSLIADGFHLPEDVLKVFLKVKPDTSFLVSDSTHLAGMPPGRYTTHIGSEVVLEAGGRLYMKDSPGSLAGSAKSLLWCISHLVDTGILDLTAAWDLASLKPLAYLSSGGVEAGMKDGVKDGAKDRTVIGSGIKGEDHDKLTSPFALGRPADLVLFQVMEKNRDHSQAEIKAGPCRQLQVLQTIKSGQSVYAFK